MKTYLEKSIPAFLVILFFFLIASLYSKFGNPLPFSVNSSVTNKSDVFTVTGEGTISVKPDIAYVSVGIQKNSSTVKQVQTQVNEVTNKIIAGLKTVGIDSKNIQTENYSINPNYDWSSGSQKITGYTANSQLKIKITDLDKINEVIDSATTNGANQVNNITLDVDNRDAAEETARKDAVAQATKKAETAARIAGFKLGKIIGYYENSNDSNLIRPVAYSLKGAGAIADQATSTNVQTGSEEVKIIVNLSYQIN
jgi:uncharacterized protein